MMRRENRGAVGKFVDFYNHHRYRMAPRYITPADKLAGRRDKILDRKREVKEMTIYRGKLSNQAPRE